jgi:hypothetical protein
MQPPKQPFKHPPENISLYFVQKQVFELVTLLLSFFISLFPFSSFFHPTPYSIP